MSAGGTIRPTVAEYTPSSGSLICESNMTESTEKKTYLYTRSRRCMVNGCTFQDKKRFYFPAEAECAEKWKEACANPKIKDVPVKRLSRKIVVCKKHFSWDQFVHPLVEKLNRGAVPTLFLPLDGYQGSMPEDEITTPLEPSLLQNVIYPPIDIGDALDLVVTNNPETCSNDSNDRKGDISEWMPSLESSVLPSDQVLPSNEENETSELEYTATETTRAESPIAPVNDYYRYTLCRLCFSIYDRMVSIFQEGETCGFVIRDAIEDLLRFKVSKADDYPQFICEVCLTKLGELKEFKDKFLKRKEAFDEELRKQRPDGCNDNEDIVTETASDEGLQKSQEIGSMKCSSDIEDISEGLQSEGELDQKNSTYDENEKMSLGDNSDEVDYTDESNSEDEEAITDVEDAEGEELAESDTKRNMNMTKMVIKEDYRCGECGKIFKYLNLYRRHAIEHQKTRPIPCQYCGKRYNTLVDLNNHIIMHSDYKPFECEHCGLRCRLKSTLAKHKRTHSDDKSFQCSTCNLSFRDWHTLRHHMKLHLDIKNYKCEECGKEFRALSTLYNHKYIHSNERPHTCGECGKSFRKKYQLNCHMKCVHLKKKLFACELCNKRFSVRKYLTSHMKTHQKRALKCDIILL